jgi:hypothetical protein
VYTECKEGSVCRCLWYFVTCQAFMLSSLVPYPTQKLEDSFDSCPWLLTEHVIRLSFPTTWQHTCGDKMSTWYAKFAEHDLYLEWLDYRMWVILWFLWLRTQEWFEIILIYKETSPPVPRVLFWDNELSETWHVGSAPCFCISLYLQVRHVKILQNFIVSWLEA